MKRLFPAVCMFSCMIAAHSFAGSATWNVSPSTGDWNTAANWTPPTVPNGPSDIATFATSNTTNLSLSASSTEVASIVFDPGASSFNITADPAAASSSVLLTISGAGIINNSEVTQNLVAGPTIFDNGAHAASIYFMNAASAGDRTVLTLFGSAKAGAFNGSFIGFYDGSTAGFAALIVNGALAGDEAYGGQVYFNDNTTAGNASFTINGARGKPGFAFGGKVNFYDDATAADASFVINPGMGAEGGGGEMGFGGNATTANAIFTLNGATTEDSEGPEVDFSGNATAANSLFTINGGQEPGNSGGFVVFWSLLNGELSTAGTATFILNGGDGPDVVGGEIAFFQRVTAAQATLIANGGVNGGKGGLIRFEYGGVSEARIELFGNGTLDIDSFQVSALTVGSLEGDGIVLLDTATLSVGSNNLSTTFSGIIQDAGSLKKIGTGTLSLSSANTYTGGTTISSGTLLVKNTSGSATGTGTVTASGGTLGGKGIISGATKVGTGNGAGGTLQPGKGASKPTTLTIQNSLTFKSNGTYTWKLNTKKAKADQVIANGVTIESGAQFDFNVVGNERLSTGTVFTAISNTATSPISGAFANLADGSTVTIGVNKLEVSYSGGDGNDLTLTVVL